MLNIYQQRQVSERQLPVPRPLCGAFRSTPSVSHVLTYFMLIMTGCWGCYYFHFTEDKGGTKGLSN